MSASHIYLLICMNLIKKIIIIKKKRLETMFPTWYFSPLSSSPVCLTLFWYCKEKWHTGHPWDILEVLWTSWKVYGQEGIKNSKIEHLALLTLKNLVKKPWYYIKIKPYSWMKIAWRNYNRTFIKRSLREMARWTFKTGWPFVKVFTD